MSGSSSLRAPFCLDAFTEGSQVTPDCSCFVEAKTSLNVVMVKLALTAHLRPPAPHTTDAEIREDGKAKLLSTAAAHGAAAPRRSGRKTTIAPATAPFGGSARRTSPSPPHPNRFVEFIEQNGATAGAVPGP